MIKAIVTDFGRVLLFPKDEGYTGLLNDLHEQLSARGDYDFWSYFRMDDELLRFYATLSKTIDVYIFTSRHIQEYPPVAKRIAGVFKGVVSAARIGVDKKTPSAYVAMAKGIWLQPEEVMFIDDTEATIVAAKAAGMVTVFHESSEKTIREVQQRLVSQ